jgi:hypothetical protein
MTELQVLQEINNTLEWIQVGVFVIAGAAIIDFLFGK